MLSNLKIASWGSLLFISVLLLTNCGGGGGGSSSSDPGSSLPKPVTLASGLKNALPLTVDSSNVYWTEYDTGTVTVKKMSTAGGAATTVASSPGLNKPKTWDIAVDSDSVYWIEQSGSSCSLKKVGKNEINGTGTLLTSDPVKPMGLAIDSSSIYYADADVNGGSVKKIDKISWTTTILAPNQDQPHYITANSTDVYWVNDSDGSIMKVDINGATQPQKIGVTTLAMKRTFASLIIAVDSSNLYFIDSPDGTTNGTIKKLDPNKSGGDHTLVIPNTCSRQYRG